MQCSRCQMIQMFQSWWLVLDRELLHFDPFGSRECYCIGQDQLLGCIMDAGIGKNKKHALEIYDQFALNTSCFLGKYWIKYYLSCAISRNFCYKNNEYSINLLLLLLKQKFREIAQLCTLQKKEFCTQRNAPAKHFKICYILCIRKPT